MTLNFWKINAFINDNQEIFTGFLAIFTVLTGGIIILIIKNIIEKQENYQKEAEKMAKICRKEHFKNPEPESEALIEKNEQKEPEKCSKLSEMDVLNCKLGKLHGKLATAQMKAENRKIEEQMSKEQLDQETRMKNAQMESIMKLMMANQEKFGMNSEDVQEQMNLYKF